MHRLTDTIQELARANRELEDLMGQAELLVDAPPRADHAPGLASLLDRMLDNLTGQFELEERHDYMAEVLEQYPSWHPQVAHLQQEHRLLRQQLQEIRDRLRRQQDAGTFCRESRRQLRDWIAWYRDHQRREAALVLDAFTLEPGAGE